MTYNGCHISCLPFLQCCWLSNRTLCTHKSVFYIRNFTIIVCELRTFLLLFASAFGTSFRVNVCVFTTLHSSWKYNLAWHSQFCKFEEKNWSLIASQVLMFFSSSGLFWAHTHRRAHSHTRFTTGRLSTSDAISRFRFGFGIGFWLCSLSKESCTTATTMYILPWSYSIHSGEKEQVIYHINEDLNKGAKCV